MGLVEQFIIHLQASGVEVRETSDPREKFFRATKSGNAIAVLAHESKEIGVWDIRESLLGECEANWEKPENKLRGWGASLLDKTAVTGFWISGENYSELFDCGFVSQKKNGAILFDARRLREHPDLAPYFRSIEQFLQLSGLDAKLE